MKLTPWTLFITLLFIWANSLAQEAAAAVTQPQPHTIISRDVIVTPGDTFQTISKKTLGRAGFAPHIADFNNIPIETPLVPGDIIRIPIHVPARREFAQVVFVKGSVVAHRTTKIAREAAENIDQAPQQSEYSSSQMVSLSRDSEVFPGDLIDTGTNGFASIEFSSGSVINLQPNTEARLNRLNCLPADDSCVIDIRTIRGKVTSNVKTREDQPMDFRISTPYASAAVRGTVFDIDVDASALLVGVTEGAVDLSSDAADTKTTLNLGFGSVVKQGQAPSDPIALLPAPVFQRIPARLAAGDTIGWWPNPRAAEYAALVSTNASGLESLTAFNVRDQRVGFDDIESGDYYLHLRAIDANGLRGFSTSSLITIADIDPSVEPVDTNVVTQGSEYLVEVINPVIEALGYEIQISNDQSFSDPLSVDVDDSGAAVFRIDDDTVFTRARVLLDPFTVSAFGQTSSTSR
ncbi:MAG: FecR domain-containing protein [Granulosicoccus sp.]